MGKSFREVKCMEALLIPTKWDTTNSNDTAKRLVLTEVDTSETNKVSKEDVKTKSELVWANTSHGVDTLQYFRIFDVAPTDDAQLTKKKE